jgi:hypothetical protein
MATIYQDHSVGCALPVRDQLQQAKLNMDAALDSMRLISHNLLRYILCMRGDIIYREVTYDMTIVNTQFSPYFNRRHHTSLPDSFRSPPTAFSPAATSFSVHEPANKGKQPQMH